MKAHSFSPTLWTVTTYHPYFYFILLIELIYLYSTYNNTILNNTTYLVCLKYEKKIYHYT